MTRRRRLVLGCATAGLTALLATLAAEVAARRLYAENFQVLVDAREDHPYRPWLAASQTWGEATYPLFTNSLGWKDGGPNREVPRDPAPRERLVLLGDSFTEGVGTPAEETAAGFAQRRLDAGGRRFEVLNGGRVSYSPLLSYQRLKRFLAAGYRTRSVALLLDPSDVQDEVLYGARYDFGPDGEPLGFRDAKNNPPWRQIYNASALARGLARRWERWGDARPGAGPAGDEDGPRHLAAAAADGVVGTAELLALPLPARDALRANWMEHGPSLDGWVKEGSRRLEASLGRLMQLAAEHGVSLLLVVYPWPQMLYTEPDPALYATLRERFPSAFEQREWVLGERPSSRESGYRHAVHDLACRYDLPLLDLVPDFRAQRDWPLLFVAGDVHFSAEGSRLVGEAIARAVAPESSPARDDRRCAR